MEPALQKALSNEGSCIKLAVRGSLLRSLTDSLLIFGSFILLILLISSVVIRATVGYYFGSFAGSHLQRDNIKPGKVKWQSEVPG